MIKTGIHFVLKLFVFCVACLVFGSTGAKKGDSQKKASSEAAAAVQKPAKADASSSEAASGESVPTHNLGEGWKPVREVEGVFTYALKSQSDTIGVFHTQALPQPLSFEEARSKKFMDEVTKNKKKMLAVMGITDWTMTRQKLTNRKGYMKWNIEGHYKDSSGEQVFFNEVHLYYPRQLHQILITSPEAGFIKNKVSKEFIKTASGVLVQRARTKSAAKAKKASSS